MKQLLAKIVGRWGRRASLITAGALAGALVLLLCVTRPSLLRQVDLKLYDHFLVRAAGGKHPGVATLIDVDEASLTACGQWPWPRYRLAMLVDRLLEAGAVSVVLDIMLAEPDRTSVDAVLRDLDGSLGVKARVEDLPEAFRDNDRLLAETLRGKPVVLGAYLTFATARGQTGNGALNRPGTAEPNTDEPGGAKHFPQGLNVIERARPGAIPVRERLTRADGMATPVTELSDAATIGFFNAGLDQDGLESIGVGKFSFPVSASGSMLVPFRGPARTFTYISAIDIFET